jgi:hypothetical protein
VHNEFSPTDQQDWVARELATIDLGDERLNRRAEVLLSMLADKPNVSIPAACNGWAETKAAYRFCANEKVTPAAVMEPHFKATRQRIAGADVVLCIEDTSEIDYTTKKDIEGLGPLNYEARQGLYLHPMIAVTPDRLCHGLLNYQSIIREQGSLETKPDPHRPIEEKESIRWRNGYEHASSLQKDWPQTRFIYVADREADFFELLTATTVADSTSKAGFVIRSQHDRILDNNKKLRATLAQSPVVGEMSFDIPSKGNRNARTVVQQLHVKQVSIKAPAHLKGETTIEVTAVYAVETNPPKNQDPITWMLLTSEPVATGQEAATVVRWYLCRWQIEIFFRILKSGCKIEELQLQHVERIEVALAFYCIIAWRVLWLTMLGRNCPEMSCDAVFETDEWQAAYIVKNKQTPPKIPPDLNAMISTIASFGGFLGRKSDGFPGPQSLWIGLQRVRDFAEVIAAQREINDSS